MSKYLKKMTDLKIYDHFYKKIQRLEKDQKQIIIDIISIADKMNLISDALNQKRYKQAIKKIIFLLYNYQEYISNLNKIKLYLDLIYLYSKYNVDINDKKAINDYILSTEIELYDFFTNNNFVINLKNDSNNIIDIYLHFIIYKIYYYCIHERKFEIVIREFNIILTLVKLKNPAEILFHDNQIDNKHLLIIEGTKINLPYKKIFHILNLYLLFCKNMQRYEDGIEYLILITNIYYNLYLENKAPFSGKVFTKFISSHLCLFKNSNEQNKKNFGNEIYELIVRLYNNNVINKKQQKHLLIKLIKNVGLQNFELCIQKEFINLFDIQDPKDKSILFRLVSDTGFQNFVPIAQIRLIEIFNTKILYIISVSLIKELKIKPTTTTHLFILYLQKYIDLYNKGNASIESKSIYRFIMNNIKIITNFNQMDLAINSQQYILQKFCLIIDQLIEIKILSDKQQQNIYKKLTKIDLNIFPEDKKDIMREFYLDDISVNNAKSKFISNEEKIPAGSNSDIEAQMPPKENHFRLIIKKIENFCSIL